MLLTGTLVAGLCLSMAPRASADPPWAGKWKHKEERSWNRHGHWNWRQSSWDRDDGRRWNGWGRNDWTRRYDWSYGGYRHDPTYAKMMDRIRFDRAKINEIEPTGRHRKALQWYKDDLRNAQRYLHENYYARR
jgi:hypothetical protein